MVVDIKVLYGNSKKMKNSIFLIFLALSIALTAGAQSEVQIESNGSKILLSVWSGGANPIATVLAIPGWGGGPKDVLDIGKTLSANNITVVVLCSRGWHNSEGIASFSNGLEDIKEAIDWIRNSDRDDIISTNIILGGHSWGGGMSLAYSARDASIIKIFSIAGTDHGILIRKYISERNFAELIDRGLSSTAYPEGSMRFDPADIITELKDSQEVLGLLENANSLNGRDILMFGGWEDTNISIDVFLLPNYREYKSKGVKNIIFKVYHDDHGFRRARQKILSDLVSWISEK